MSNHRLRVELLEDRRVLAVVLVDTEFDVIDFNDGKTSLREAIFATNLAAGADTIEFDASLAGKTILLKHGELAINDALTISGPGRELLTIDASGNDPTPNEDNGDGSRVLSIFNSGYYEPWPSDYEVVLRGLTLTGGDSADLGGGLLAGQSMRLVGVAVVDNSSLGHGGGIYVRASEDFMLTEIQDSEIAFNRSAGTWSSGGGIAIDNKWYEGLVTIRDSSIHGNQAFGNWADGGGMSILNRGHVELVGNLIAGNQAIGTWATGGGVQLGELGTTEILYNTFSGNIARGTWAQGGGLAIGSAQSSLVVQGNLLEGNTADGAYAYGGGMYADVTSSPLQVIDNRILDNLVSGYPSAGGGLAFQFHNGGEVLSHGNTIAGNEAAEGGGISLRNLRSGGTFFSTFDTISENSARSHGGGVHADTSGGRLTFVGTTISKNLAASDGGGLFTTGHLELEGSTISGNTASWRGGGIFGFGGTMAIRRSTITDNQAGSADGIYLGGLDLTLDGAIIAGNHASEILQVASSIQASFSIIGNNDGTELPEATTSGLPDSKGNLIGGPVHGVIDPLLGPLQDNGGPTPTHALLSGSPAIDAGNLYFLAPPYFDQRGWGFDRVANGRIDMGAFELQETNALADYDGDGDGDGRDFLLWQRGGSPNPLSSGDLALWQEQYGTGGLSALSSPLSALRAGSSPAPTDLISDLGFLVADVGEEETVAAIGYRIPASSGRETVGVVPSDFESVRFQAVAADRAIEQLAAVPGSGVRSFGDMVVRRHVRHVAAVDSLF